MEIPSDGQAFFQGAWHKMGLHRKPYIWIQGGWVRSTKDPGEVQRMIKKYGRRLFAEQS